MRRWIAVAALALAVGGGGYYLGVRQRPAPRLRYLLPARPTAAERDRDAVLREILEQQERILLRLDDLEDDIAGLQNEHFR